MSTDLIRLRLCIAGGEYVTVDAVPLTVEGDLGLCVHQSIVGRGWTVSCRETGLRLGSGRVPEEVIDSVLAQLYDAAAEQGISARECLDQHRAAWRSSTASCDLLGGEVPA